MLQPGQSLLHDRDTACCAALKQTLDDAGIKRVPLPPRSPWVHAVVERWVTSVQEEAVSRMIRLGERSLRAVLGAYVSHDHEERPHQGQGNSILFPSAQAPSGFAGPIDGRKRLGGLLQYSHRKAA